MNMSQPEEPMETSQSIGRSQSLATGPPNYTYHGPQGAQPQAVNPTISTQSGEQVRQSEDSSMEVDGEDLYTAGLENQEVGRTEQDINTTGQDNQGISKLPVTQQPLRSSQIYPPLQTLNKAMDSIANNPGFISSPNARDSTSQTNPQENPTPLKEQTSASLDAQDVAMVLVQLDWKGKETPPKWEMNLEKSLQTLLNKKFPGAVTIERLVLLTLETIKIVISPSKGCEILLNMKNASLKFKDNSEVEVHFKYNIPLEDNSPVAANLTQSESYMQKTQHTRIPLTVSVEVDTRKYTDELANSLLGIFARYRKGSHTLTVSGTFEEVDAFQQQFNQVVGNLDAIKAQTTSEHSSSEQMKRSHDPMRVPLLQYWYFNHMYRKEIERIQEKHRVEIEASVCVEIKEMNGSKSTSFIDSSQEFQNLFLKHTAEICSVSVPNAIEVAKDIQGLNSNLMLNGSCQNWSLVGPRNQVDSVLKFPKLKIDTERSEGVPREKTQNNTAHRAFSWDGPKGIEMNIVDPAISNGININNTHWEILKNAYMKQIKNLENKFGVAFQESSNNGGKTVKAQSPANQIPNLELNAMRALMCLYQKVAMSTMSCSLQNVSFNQTDKVKKRLDELRVMNPSLGVETRSDSNGVWMLIGIQDHLRFAVREIEKTLGGFVFDRDHKDMIGYDQDAEFMRPFTDGPSWEWSGAVYHGSINAPGALRGFEEGAERDRTYERAERKETNGFGNNQKTVPDFKGGPRDDHTTQPTGADGEEDKEDKCPICMDEFTNKEKIPCGHCFCKECLKRCLDTMGAKCPVCTKVFGRIEGNQPEGTMNTHINKSTLPGFKKCGTIVINYNIPSGIQTRKHPKPGRPFYGAQRTAYLPDNKEGKEVLALLKRAFDQKLIFTVGTSRTSGSDDCVTWNDVHHKTNISGGPQSFGYPDDTYLKRVREELKAKGIE